MHYLWVDCEALRDYICLFGEIGMIELTPNVKALAIMRASVIAIPAGSGLEAGIATILEGRLGETMRQGIEWAEKAIALVKTAPDNPYGDDNEAIAGHLLKLAQERRDGYTK